MEIPHSEPRTATRHLQLTVCLETKHPFGAYDQILIIVWQLRVCWFGAPSLTRGRVCRLQLLLALPSAVIFGSESRRTRGHILQSKIRDFPFRRLLRLARSRWRYSTPPPHGSGVSTSNFCVWHNPSADRISQNLVYIVYTYVIYVHYYTMYCACKIVNIKNMLKIDGQWLRQMTNPCFLQRGRSLSANP
jgi:hypothetical protein